MRRVVPRDILERLTPGDLVVHIDHGVARYEQMLRRGSRRARSATTSSCRSPGGDRIFVPVEQIGRVSRYSGGERPQPQQARRHRVAAGRSSASARPSTDLADELLELYAARSAAPRATRSATDTPWQAEMEASFPYEETVDQLRAAAEAKADMERVRPMDRLVVGDVGYGKTEVALRAAFKATQDGKQVAVLVPTTVLAAQHHRDVQPALRGVPARGPPPVAVRVREGAGGGARGAGGRDRGHRHRHAPAAQQGRPVQGPRAGRRRRGAAVRRGRQGAAEAAPRSEVDVLTLSATPIPRTLNLALAGVRDLSRHRDAARGPAPDPDARRRGVRRAGARRDPARARPRRPGLLRPQPGRDDRGAGRAAAPDAARRALRRRARADGRGRAREGHARVRRWRGGRARVHDDHRIRSRHPERQHDRHRPRRHARPRPALPAPRTRRVARRDAPTRTCSTDAASG